MTVDVERAGVYAAECAAFDGTDLEEVREFDELAELLASLTTGEWWPGPTVTIRRARRDARSSSTRCEGDVSHDLTTISMAGGQQTIATLAHELAHALAGVRHGHGPTFRAAYLDVISVVTNLDPSSRRRDLHVAQLTSAFAAAGLAVGPRHWPLPPDSIAGPIAL